MREKEKILLDASNVQLCTSMLNKTSSDSFSNLFHKVWQMFQMITIFKRKKRISWCFLIIFQKVSTAAQGFDKSRKCMCLCESHLYSYDSPYKYLMKLFFIIYYLYSFKLSTACFTCLGQGVICISNTRGRHPSLFFINNGIVFLS